MEENEEKKEKKVITLSLGTGVSLIVILILSIIILAGVYYYEINKMKKDNMDDTENIENTTTNTVATENIVTEKNTEKEENISNDNSFVIDKNYEIEGSEKFEEGFGVALNFSNGNFFMDLDDGRPGISVKGTFTETETGIDLEVKTWHSGSEFEHAFYSYDEAKGEIHFKKINKSTLELTSCSKIEGRNIITDELGEIVSQNYKDIDNSIKIGTKFILKEEIKFRTGTYKLENKDAIIKFNKDYTFDYKLGNGNGITGSYELFGNGFEYKVELKSEKFIGEYEKMNYSGVMVNLKEIKDNTLKVYNMSSGNKNIVENGVERSVENPKNEFLPLIDGAEFVYSE